MQSPKLDMLDKSSQACYKKSTFESEVRGMSEAPKKRGRTPLSPEEREIRRITENKRAMERHKRNGYAAQKKYRVTHPERYRQNYEPKIRIPLEFKPLVENLTKSTGLSITQLFVSAVEEKYQVILHRDIENADKV